MTEIQPEEVIEPAIEPSQVTRTEPEKAAFSLKKNAERAKELGLDPAEILGLKTHVETNPNDEDGKVVTVGMLRDIQKKDATTTALQMAETITDEETKAVVKQYLAENITPSGDAEKDFKIALAAASAEKNKTIVQELSRYVAPKRTASGGSIGAKVEEEFVPTADEQTFMRPPYNVPKEKILETRRKAQS